MELCGKMFLMKKPIATQQSAKLFDNAIEWINKNMKRVIISAYSLQGQKL